MAHAARFMKAAKVYARTVFELAQAQGVADEVTAEMRALASLFAAEAGVRSALQNPILSGEKKATLAQPLIARATALTGKLIRLLAEKNRLAVLPDLADAYLRIEEQARHIQRAKVVSAKPMTEAQLQALSQILAAKRPGMTYQLENTVDDHLVAGFRVEEGDNVLDASLRNKLDQLKQRLAA